MKKVRERRKRKRIKREIKKSSIVTLRKRF